MDAAVRAPVPREDRVLELDALRGFALLGVIIANYVGLGSAGQMATEAQLAALPSAAADSTASFFTEWLVHDKANTLFAFLFGVGFSLQMGRLSQAGAGEEAIYLRRLWILLIAGVLNTIFLFAWDVLHLYAICGFILYAMRKISDRMALFLGLAFALLGRVAVAAVADALGASRVVDAIYGDAAVLERQTEFLSGDYGRFVATMWKLTLHDWIISGLVVGWIFYALGRFLLGLWTARKGWLQRAAALRSFWLTIALIALPIGLAGEYGAAYLGRALEAETIPHFWRYPRQIGHLITVPFLAAGYASLIVLGWNSVLRPLLTPIAALGRMALTNYILHGIVIAYVLYHVGFGLGLAGHIGASGLIKTAFLTYGALVAFSVAWLSVAEYGPLEWIWRALTYGRAPRFLKRARGLRAP